jgi:hypothetical protein
MAGFLPVFSFAKIYNIYKNVDFKPFL